MGDADRSIRRAALQDAVRRDGRARWDVVLDRVVADDPSRRGLDEQELRARVRLVVAEVNAMDLADQRSALDEDA